MPAGGTLSGGEQQMAGYLKGFNGQTPAAFDG